MDKSIGSTRFGLYYCVFFLFFVGRWNIWIVHVCIFVDTYANCLPLLYDLCIQCTVMWWFVRRKNNNNNNRKRRTKHAEPYFDYIFSLYHSQSVCRELRNLYATKKTTTTTHGHISFSARLAHCGNKEKMQIKIINSIVNSQKRQTVDCKNLFLGWHGISKISESTLFHSAVLRSHSIISIYQNNDQMQPIVVQT